MISLRFQHAEAPMDWMTTREAADLWGVTIRRVQGLCDDGELNGAMRMGQIWLIPKSTPKPLDGRTKLARETIRQQRRTNQTTQTATSRIER
jgi:excisionase family DNA binding protein